MSESLSSDHQNVSAAPQRLPGVTLVPGWERFPWLRAGFSTRVGGRSTVYGPGEQNLAWTAEDNAAHVAQNRENFVATAGRDTPMSLVTLHQIHGNVIRDLDVEAGPLMNLDGRARLKGDGSLTRTPGRLVGVITADCVPVLLADTRSRTVAALHAGWRGTLARIVEQGVAAMLQDSGSQPGDVIAAIGPCIGACCFAVGEEVRSGFTNAFSYGDALLSSMNSRDSGVAEIHLDLVEANRRQLLAAGLPAKNISSLAECTACTRLADGRRKYYSHRAEHGFAGRMLNVIGVVSAEPVCD